VPPLAPQAGPGEVAVWRGGRQVAIIRQADAAARGLLLVDVGRAWAPSLLRSVPNVPHAYESRFVALADGDFDDSPEGRRARRDRFLELYGIPPTPRLLEQRLGEVSRRTCHKRRNPPAWLAFEGVAWDEEGDEPEAPVDPAIVQAVQSRLRCDGHLRSTPSGSLDLKTRYALEEFERRHRIYARGSLQGETLGALRRTPLELERQALVRVLTERVVLDQGLIEDGSAFGARPGGMHAREPVAGSRNVVARLRAHIAQALGIETVEGTRELYRQLQGALERPHHYLALDPIELPSYYGADMDLFVEIDRGDVYYDFPYDENGDKRAQPKERKPVLTLYARAQETVIPLASYGTTIGGWRILNERGRDVYAYKESPVGPRAWRRVVSAPVWLPPPSTPPTSLVLESRQTLEGTVVSELNENLVGPSYASAYGLVAAYHRRFHRRSDGKMVIGRDEGIRTHGSSDYTSIWRRASLGCHRLHNHLALRLFSFVLAHRHHHRMGHGTNHFRMPVTLGEFSSVIEVDRSGYAFELERPVVVEVLPGRILGEAQRASQRRIPVEEIANGKGSS
jgi:hypothetical protein